MNTSLLQDYSDKTVCFVDYGLFLSFAAKVAQDFGRTLFYDRWDSAFPSTKERCIGQGVEGVTSVDDFWRYLDEIDLFVFLDVYQGELQLALEKMGKRVWGSRRGEEIETQRHHSKRLLESVGLDAGDWEMVTGISALRAYLKRHPETFVKISATRGDAETFYAKNYKNIAPRLDDLVVTLGPHAETFPFLCEAKIPDAVEIAYDGYTVDGRFPSATCFGIESKSKGYLGHFVDYQDLPAPLQEMNAAVAPALRAYGYRNFFAMEARITRDGVAHVIDPACRAGSPPSEMLQEMYSNLPDIFWYGAEGTLIDPIPAAAWGAELVLHATWAEEHWLELDFPPAIREQVKLRNYCVVDGKTYIVPGSGCIGAVVALGDSKQEAIEACKKAAEKVEGYTVETNPDAFDEIEKAIEQLEETGIEF